MIGHGRDDVFPWLQQPFKSQIQRFGRVGSKDDLIWMVYVEQLG